MAWEAAVDRFSRVMQRLRIALFSCRSVEGAAWRAAPIHGTRGAHEPDMRHVRSLALSASLLVVGAVSMGAPTKASAAPVVADPFAPLALKLVDQVECGSASDPHVVTEDPVGASTIETIGGVPTRTMANTAEARYFAYTLGKGKGLVAGKAYVLAIEYPEDAPRTLFVVNRGSETTRGVSTGPTTGDVLTSYGNQNHESLKIPLAGKSRTFRMMFRLHDRFGDLKVPREASVRPHVPADGFWVAIAQPAAKNAPFSKGAAASKISLYEVTDESKLVLDVHYPPDGLPRRHLFWREEMADGVVSSMVQNERGYDEPLDWYEHKLQLMQFLGMNAFSKDLLEFGHNQGWDSTPFGGNAWYYQSKYPDRWGKIVALATKYGFPVLPYYEYAGSIGSAGLGSKKLCKTLSGKETYTHITWSENANADVTDPQTLVDIQHLLDATIGGFKGTKFLGAWLRTRVSEIPISFSDRCLGLFAKEANGGVAIDRTKLTADAALRTKYYGWWYGKRKTFLLAVRDHLRTIAGADADLWFTAYTGEPGADFGGGVVTDDPAPWTALAVKNQSYDDVLKSGSYVKATLSMPPTWGGWEWDHSIPPPDPSAYADTDGVLFTYPFNRLYTVSSEKGFDAFRMKSGLSIVRHFSLNENSMDDKLGYFVSDVDRAGPYSMLAEARAMAYGDPSSIGYLSSADFNRAFPEYVRAFDAAYLALPALPSKLEAGAASNADVMVRSIATPKDGTYLSVVNVAMIDRDDVTVRLPVVGHVTDLVTLAELPVSDGKVTLSLYPGQLVALRVTDAPVPGVDAGPSGGDGGVDAAGPGPTSDGGPSADSSGDAPGSGGAAGCGCRTASPSSRDTSVALVVAAVLVAAMRRRRALA
jgi:MYXO-CTERM domain-containing protein